MSKPNHPEVGDEPSEEWDGKCPARNAVGKDNSHAPYFEEQPEDMGVFYVWRCSLCGTVFDTWETEDEYLDEFGADDGSNEHTKEYGDLF